MKPGSSPPDEREWLAELLLIDDKSFSAVEVESAWDTEIKRRLDEIDSGKVKTIPGRRSSHAWTLVSKPSDSKSRRRNEALSFPPGS
jgi:hypothetical protein